MQLFAYNQVGRPDELVIWVGVMGVLDPPSVTFKIAGVDHVKPKNSTGSFELLGDGQQSNHRAIFIFDWPATSERFPVEVTCGDKTVYLTSKRPPLLLPTSEEASFNLLLSSCYYQPNDKTQQNFAWLVKQIKPAPDFTLLAGDQVYLDLPSLQNLPKDKTALAQTLGKKYQMNWFSSQLSQPGLADVLAQGPVLCIPDDHEYWNNYPYFQAQLTNTHSEKDRNNWRNAAMLLYQRYQMAPIQKNGFFRQDIEPLSMLFIDGRSARDDKDNLMFTQATIDAIKQWATDLLNRKAANLAAVGLLSSGQALLVEKPSFLSSRLADMEMANFQDFKIVEAALTQLIQAGVPVIYITGDVHWGRIIEGRNKNGQVMLYEVIASPSRLIDTIGKDQKSYVENKIQTTRGNVRPFPYHSDPPEQVPDIKLANLDFAIKHRQTGDHVALLRFNRIPGGITLAVDYYCTDPDENKRTLYTQTIAPIKITSLN